MTKNYTLDMLKTLVDDVKPLEPSDDRHARSAEFISSADQEINDLIEEDALKELLFGTWNNENKRNTAIFCRDKLGDQNKIAGIALQNVYEMCKEHPAREQIPPFYIAKLAPAKWTHSKVTSEIAIVKHLKEIIKSIDAPFTSIYAHISEGLEKIFKDTDWDRATVMLVETFRSGKNQVKKLEDQLEALGKTTGFGKINDTFASEFVNEVNDIVTAIYNTYCRDIFNFLNKSTK